MKTLPDTFRSLSLEEQSVTFYCCVLALGAECIDIENKSFNFPSTQAQVIPHNSPDAQTLATKLLISLQWLFYTNGDYNSTQSIFHKQKVVLLKNYLLKFHYFYAYCTKLNIVTINSSKLNIVALTLLKLIRDNSYNPLYTMDSFKERYKKIKADFKKVEAPTK
jgi:hypothetical protein